MPLPYENLLIGLAEVAAAFVGFSLVIEVLRAEATDLPREAQRLYSMRDVAEVGLIAAGAAFLPLVIHSFEAGHGTVWRLGSGILFVVAGASALFSFARHGAASPRGLLGELRASPVRSGLIQSLNLGSFGLLLSNVVAPGATSGARYIAAVLGALAVAGIIFVTETFSDRPAA